MFSTQSMPLTTARVPRPLTPSLWDRSRPVPSVCRLLARRYRDGVSVAKVQVSSRWACMFHQGAPLSRRSFRIQLHPAIPPQIDTAAISASTTSAHAVQAKTDLARRVNHGNVVVSGMAASPSCDVLAVALHPCVQRVCSRR